MMLLRIVQPCRGRALRMLCGGMLINYVADIKVFCKPYMGLRNVICVCLDVRIRSRTHFYNTAFAAVTDTD